MIGLDSQARIWLCAEPTNMRKSFRGLSALVRAATTSPALLLYAHRNNEALSTPERNRLVIPS